MKRLKQVDIIYSLIGFAYLILFFIIKDDPFYGDSKSTISRLSILIFESNFNTCIYPKGMDPGHPSTFPLIHAGLWKLFGKHLWISHALQLLTTFSAFAGIYKLEKSFKTRGWIALLTAANPIFIAMFASLNTHMALLLFLVWYLTQIGKNKWFLKSLCIAGLLLTHNQGMLIATVLLGSETIFYRNYKSIGLQLLGILPWILWLVIHKSVAGWYLFPPEYAEFRGVGTPKILFKNALMIVWRLLDFGMFTLFFLGLYQVLKQKEKALYLLLFIALGITGATWLAVKFSLAHRYFIFVTFILAIPSAQLLKNSKTWKQLIVLLILISGSFWYYPGKQLSDANILYRSYFQIYNQIQNHPVLSKLSIYSTPPNESHSKITHLRNGEKLLDIRSLSESADSSNVNIIMQGNLCGKMSKNWIKKTAQWKSIYFTDGAAWVQILVNPRLSTTIDSEEFSERTPGNLELLIRELKQKYQ